MKKQNGKRPGKRRINAMQAATIVVAALLALCIVAFGAYVLYEKARYERALRNYPAAYTEEIRSSAEEFSLDPYLVQSIMRCESSNDPLAVSDAGAIGLMQIMPDTGKWIAHKLDMDDVYSDDLLYDPATNVRFACWYLRFLSGRFDGDVMEIVAAYNAGHGSVEEWLADARFSQEGKLMTIPFEQTARYYEKVMTAYENYTTLYPDLFFSGGDVEADSKA